MRHERGLLTTCNTRVAVVLSAVVLTVGAVDAAPSRPGDDLLQRRCREKSHDEAFSGLIKPVDRKSCAFFAEQNAYLPYELKVETAGDVTKLKGTVAGIGSYEGALVACGTASRCLQIEKSPEDKINGALMFYSNAEVETSNEKVTKALHYSIRARHFPIPRFRSI